MQPSSSKIFVLVTILNLHFISNVFANDQEHEIDDSQDSLVQSKSIFDFFNTNNSDDKEDEKPQEFEIIVEDKQPSTISVNGAVLRIIDKTLGKLYTVAATKGSTVNLNEMTFKLRNCLKSTEVTLLPEDKAHIEVYETRNRAVEQIFNGWIFSLEPSLSQLTHPKYDITLANCKN